MEPYCKSLKLPVVNQMLLQRDSTRVVSGTGQTLFTLFCYVIPFKSIRKHTWCEENFAISLPSLTLLDFVRARMEVFQNPECLRS